MLIPMRGPQAFLGTGLLFRERDSTPNHSLEDSPQVGFETKYLAHSLESDRTRVQTPTHPFASHSRWMGTFSER